MDHHATVLILLSAMLHPLRDLTLKSIPRPQWAYLGVTTSWVAIAALQIAGTGGSFVLDPQIWPAVAISAAGLTAYYFGTMAALRLGDLSVYYPIIRSSPFLIVAVSWLCLGHAYTPLTLAGIVLIVLGGFAIQRQPGKVFANPSALALAILAMAGSAAYTIADASAMQTAQAAAFLFWVYALVTPFLALVLLGILPAAAKKSTLAPGVEAQVGSRATGKSLAQASDATGPIGSKIQLSWFARVGFAAATSYVSYYLILLAFQSGADAAATSAVRQASIPVSVLLAAVVLGESRFLHRLGWAVVIALGIVLVVYPG